MGSQMQVRSSYRLSGLGVVITGEVHNGEITDNMIGVTSSGKRCPVVKIEVDNEVVKTAQIKDVATIVVKHIAIDDIKPGATIYFD